MQTAFQPAVRALHVRSWQCHKSQALQCKVQGKASKASVSSSNGSNGSSVAIAEPRLTCTMFERVDSRADGSRQAGGAGGSTTYQALLAADKAWSSLRNMQTDAAAGPAPEYVTALPTKSVSTARSSSSNDGSSTSINGSCMYDVVVSGGTLGVFVAAALAARGWRVAVLERAALKGRTQEWNISRKELLELVELGLLAPAEAESVIAVEFNPVRVGFHGGKDVWTRNVLNLGVRPDKLINLMRQKLESWGGHVYEGLNLAGVRVYSDGVLLHTASQAAKPEAGAVQQLQEQDVSSISTRLLLDCMGHASPIVRQLRWGHKPDGVCLVVGGCARGFDPVANTTADIIYTNTNMQPPGIAAAAAGGQPQQRKMQQLQYFWEAFPAADGFVQQSRSSNGDSSSVRLGEWSSDARTTYMFSYMDAQFWRPSLHQLFEDYWQLMPEYQQLSGGLDQLEFLRLLFGFFPTYKDSPLKPGFDRVLQIGDASGIQSPLSFGGFGALTRHLARLTSAVHDALSADALSASDLALVNSYNPGLSSAWMLQRAMVGSRSDSSPGPSPDLINKMLAGNFAAMSGMGHQVLKPFLQDVIKISPLLRTMAGQIIHDPGFVPQLMAHVGPVALGEWMLHVASLGTYSALNATVAAPLKLLANSKSISDKLKYKLRRVLEAWEFGSGADYTL